MFFWHMYSELFLADSNLRLLSSKELNYTDMRDTWLLKPDKFSFNGHTSYAHLNTVTTKSPHNCHSLTNT